VTFYFPCRFYKLTPKSIEYRANSGTDGAIKFFVIKPAVMRFLIWVVLLLSSLSVFAQSEYYNFSKLNTNTGLSHNQVQTILKDTDGFLWFGTNSGLNRYDGYSCRIFRKNYNDSSSLLDNNVQYLAELPDGKMWVGTRGGACIYDSRTEKFDADYNTYLHSIGLPPGGVTSIVKGNNGRFWFLYGNLDLFVYSTTDKKANLFRPYSNTLARITSVKETKDGKLWLVYQTGFLQQYDINLNKIIFSSSALQDVNEGVNPDNIFIDNDGDIWLWGLNNGAFLFQPAYNSVRQFNENSFPSRLNTNLVTHIVQDNNGLIWVATDHGGVNLINKKDKFSTSYLLNDPKDPGSLSQNSITEMYKDDNGIIWLGTYKQGVNYLNSNIVLFPIYRHQESNIKSLPYDDVNKFVEDRSGNIWIGTNGGGLIFFDRKQKAFKQYLHDPNNRNSLSNNVIVSLWIDHKNILWIGTYFGGLNSFDGKDFTHYRHSDNDTSSLSNDNVWEIYEDREQNLWIGTLGGGLDRFERATKRFVHNQYKGGPDDPLPSNYISAILQDKKGDLWVGTTGGIGVIKKNKSASVHYKRTNDKNSLANNNVSCLMEDSKGGVWVGTSEGLCLFNEQTSEFQTFTTSAGLPDNLILNILEDNHHSLWVSTANGICNIVPKQTKAGLAFSFINYDESNNLQNREFNDNAALKTRDGELIFGGPSGFNIFNPDKIQKPVYHPKIIFTGLQILNNSVEPGELINNRVLMEQSLSHLQSITLKYKENVFSIEFASLDFGHSAGGKYAYMMEGFTSEWLYADENQRRATYTNLNPGHYTFKVKVLNRDGVWSEEKTIRIHIEPPFWRTTIAYVIYGLIIAGLFLLARRITLDRIHMRYEVRNQRREAERAHALEQLKTKFFTNVSHEFRTPLTLIISPLGRIIKETNDEEQKKQLNLVQRNAKRLLGLVNQLLDFRKMEVQEIRLHPAIGDIIGFSKEISNSFMDIAEKKNIRFSFSSNFDSLEIYFDKDKIEKILFNLISNAFKYTHDNGAVSVNMVYNEPAANETDGTLAIEVKDTGIGIPPDKHERIFERFFQTDVPESMVNQGTGIGLAITKEFVRLHNGIITVKSEPDLGTCFTVLLPAKKIFDVSTRTVSIPVQEEVAEQILSEESKKSGKKKVILVAEDNEDLRFYLKENLKSDYHVEEATNGKEAWEKIKLLNPDLIVSDIMMPLMDGIELTRKIKGETMTAHIPVILLTAMGSEEKQLEGLKAGVNDYITKPFTFEILASRIRNLMAQQKLLQRRFQKQIEVNPGEVTITPVDEKFLKLALEVVEKNMDKPEFSVEDFSRDMYMNRVTLYRKILSLTGKKPIEFIRSIRLKRAAQLLEKSGMSVAEIAYEVGFNSPKNFTKSFKDEFKILPSQYAAYKKDKSE
jgi:signal transduction histidine kinase/ligand-binding sensor domain-containing protein/DNA-binding response OmpR family regulator